MHPTPALPPRRTVALACAVATALALTACGGGAESPEAADAADASTSATDGLRQAASVQGAALTAEAVTGTFDSASANYTAPTTVVPADTLAALDAVLGSTTQSGLTSAQQTVACPGGGDVTVSITGTPAGIVNGHPDSGETYALHFNNCVGSRTGLMNGVASVVFTSAYQVSNSTTVSSVAAGTLSLEGLSVTSPVAKKGQRLGVSVNGAVAFNRSQSVTGSTTVVNGAYSGSNVQVVAEATKGSTTFTLQELVMGRVVTWKSDVVKKIELSGHNTLVDATGRTLATTIEGTLQCDANDNPLNGIWTVATKRMGMKVSVAAGQATVEVDKGNNGSIDATYTLPVGQLISRIKP